MPFVCGLAKAETPLPCYPLDVRGLADSGTSCKVSRLPYFSVPPRQADNFPHGITHAVSCQLFRDRCGCSVQCPQMLLIDFSDACSRQRVDGDDPSGNCEAADSAAFDKRAKMPT